MKLGILCGGGPAPGMNLVISAATIEARNSGWDVVGIMDGFQHLIEGRVEEARPLSITDVSRIHVVGGSVIRTSRANPTVRDEGAPDPDWRLHACLASLRKLGVDALVTIGGDDTAFSASRLAEAARGGLRVAHVPKTIDNDLPLPGGTPTFGFETARSVGVELVNNLMTDVMTVANRAIGAPINIWNDHSDAMSQRDAGWLQLYAETSQEALDLHIQAFRIAEELSVPVMVCMDGFLLTHASERADIPEQAQVDAFLPRYEPRQVLDPGDPVSIGAMVGPEAFTEVRYLAHERMQQALGVIKNTAADFAAGFGRDSGGLVRPYRTDDAEIIVVALGSVLGTLKDAVDELRAGGLKIGVLGITSFRPFPAAAIGEALAGARRVVVLERALAPGSGGIVSADVRAAADKKMDICTVIAGLGGRAVTKKSLRGLLQAGDLPPLSFLDLNTGLVEAEAARMSAARRSGPSAENILRDLGITASRIG